MLSVPNRAQGDAAAGRIGIVLLIIKALVVFG
jgi:hypothetical protein